VPDTHEPVLVYNRVALNRRRTRWLIGSFALALLPAVTGFAVWVMPWVSLLGGAIAYAVYGQALGAKLQALEAQLEANWPAQGPLTLKDLPFPILLLQGGLLLVALAGVLLVFCAATAFLINRYGSRMVLRSARAQPVDRRREPDLVRVIENLCIGAGLPVPRIYLVESAAANAFATGRDPQHASLVVTRGLLTLLNQRELEGVIAHELSHIGNHDIRLTTALAALVSVTTTPVRIVAGLFRLAFRLHWTAGMFVAWITVPIGALFLYLCVAFISISREPNFDEVVPSFVWWWGLHAMAAPIYAVFIAPVLGLLIRQAVSREREFLADADAALLTRDPEGLALALVKIGAAGDQPLRAGEGSVHLYFVDPLSEAGSWLHALFPSHPPLAERIALLARMGSGIEPSALEAAVAAATRIRQAEASRLEAVAPASVVRPAPVPTHTPSATGRSDGNDRSNDARTPLYEKPDGWSRVLARLSPDAAITPLAREGNFVRVATEANGIGYVSSTAPLRAIRGFCV
jgi:heat shock protein HtpX